MSAITTRDGAEIYYKDWGQGQPVVFSHGWPLSADAWEDQMLFLAERGYRCIAHDRRGHGRSSQPWQGNDMDRYADDLADLVQALDLPKAIHVGHSTGGGEVARYIGRHGTRRVTRAVLIGAITPFMLKTPKNPEGTPLEAFDAIRAGVRADRSQFFRDLSVPVYGAIRQFSETDHTEDLRKFDVPTLILHGDDDQIVPIKASALVSAKLVKGAKLVVVPGAPHGLCSTEKDRINQELLAFFKA